MLKGIEKVKKAKHKITYIKKKVKEKKKKKKKNVNKK